VAEEKKPLRSTSPAGRAGAASSQPSEADPLPRVRTQFAQEIKHILRAEHADPFQILGPHAVEELGKKQIAIRAFLPRAREVAIVLPDGGAPYPAERIHPEGFFEAVIPYSDALRARLSSYRLRIAHEDATVRETYDPYAFPPLLSDLDLHLIGEGTHYLKYEKLGAHVREVAGVRGVHFAVWAPNARRVSVVGDFNHWDGRVHPMRHRGSSGVWELFLPGLEEGAIYKFEIRARSGPLPFLKADPFAFSSNSARKAARSWPTSTVTPGAMLPGWLRAPRATGSNRRWPSTRSTPDPGDACPKRAIAG
jgi:1,4-alpha-glucan branching enzyme